MLWLWIFGSATEVVVLDLLLSRWWTPLRVPLLVVGVWGLVWMLGLMAAYRTRPHLLGRTSGEGEEGILLVGVSSRTNLELQLTGPTELVTPRGPVTVTRVGLWVDEPREVAQALRGSTTAG